jgi:hypothetical protein
MGPKWQSGSNSALFALRVGETLERHILLSHTLGTPWLWTFAYGAHRDYSTTYGYAVDRDEAMKAFAKAWRGE